jgi:type IV pilus biogenesis protein CpaD/CtpE
MAASDSWVAMKTNRKVIVLALALAACGLGACASDDEMVTTTTSHTETETVQPVVGGVTTTETRSVSY